MIRQLTRGKQGTSRKPRRLTVGKEYPLYIPTRAKPVAGVMRKPDGTIELHKTIKASKHLVTLPHGIAFDEALYAEAEGLGITDVRVRDSETGLTYTATAAHFRRHAFVQDRGFGRQLFLRLDFWSIDGARPEAEQAAERQAAQRGESQLTLELFAPDTEENQPAQLRRQ